MELLLHLLVVLRGLLLHLRVWGVGRVYVEWSDQHAATISALWRMQRLLPPPPDRGESRRPHVSPVFTG